MLTSTIMEALKAAQAQQPVNKDAQDIINNMTSVSSLNEEVAMLAADYAAKQKKITIAKEVLKDLEDECKLIGEQLITTLKTLNVRAQTIQYDNRYYTISIEDNFIGSITDAPVFINWAQNEGVKVTYKLELADTTDYNTLQAIATAIEESGISLSLTPVVHHSTLRSQLKQHKGDIPGVWCENKEKINVKD